jgi:hypothetical protein
MGYIRNIMYSNDLKNKSRIEKKDFTRTRKVGFLTLLCMILNMIKKSTQLEIDEFLKRFNPEGVSNNTYTKQSFSEARQKLSPKAFTILNDAFIEKFYEDGDFKKFNEYRLLAIDGCSIEVPNNTETRKVFGFVKNQTEEFKLARALSSKVYDVENKILVASILGRCDDNERELAIKNIEKLKSIENSKIKDLILFDRGYPSIAFISWLIKKDIKFLMRSSSGFLKEINSSHSKDEYVEIEITKYRAKELKRQGTPIPCGTILTLRVLKIKLNTGETEVLITSLNHDELKYEESKELYFKRWGIETKFDELKNKFEIENFSGEKPLLVEQDFYASVLLSNMAAVFEHDAEEDSKVQNAKKGLKYEYKINKNILVGKLKNNLIEMLLEDDDSKKSLMYDSFIKEIQRNVVPVIKERTFERNKIIRANKYSKARRRAL